MKKNINIILFGAPGVGKGTQAKRLSAELTIPHIDTGNLIRKAITNETELGLEVKSFVEAGKLVPDELVIELIKDRLNMLLGLELNGFILDGFPRTTVQADALEVVLKELDLDITKVLNIKAPEALLAERVSSRRLCSNKNCGAIYNTITKKPKTDKICDLCSSELYQRKDDTEEAMLERLKEYTTKTASLEKYYVDKGKLANIDGSKDPEEVYKEILKVLGVTLMVEN